MKKMVVPALLCATYTASLAGFFSTDFAKKHSFFFSSTPAPVVQAMAPVNAGMKIQQTLSEQSPVVRTVHFASETGASPESASR